MIILALVFVSCYKSSVPPFLYSGVVSGAVAQDERIPLVGTLPRLMLAVPSLPARRDGALCFRCDCQPGRTVVSGAILANPCDSSWNTDPILFTMLCGCILYTTNVFSQWLNCLQMHKVLHRSRLLNFVLTLKCILQNVLSKRVMFQNRWIIMLNNCDLNIVNNRAHDFCHKEQTT